MRSRSLDPEIVALLDSQEKGDCYGCDGASDSRFVVHPTGQRFCKPCVDWMDERGYLKRFS